MILAWSFFFFCAMGILCFGCGRRFLNRVYLIGMWLESLGFLDSGRLCCKSFLEAGGVVFDGSVVV